jgi:hypothetical protein
MSFTELTESYSTNEDINIIPIQLNVFIIATVVVDVVVVVKVLIKEIHVLLLLCCDDDINYTDNDYDNQ